MATNLPTKAAQSPNPKKPKVTKPKAAPKTKPKTKSMPTEFDPLTVSEEDEKGEGINDQLSDRQIIFCNSYVTHWNATRAARDAKYKDPECSGYENRQKPAIRRYIERKISERCITADELLVHLGDIVRGRHKQYFAFFDANMEEEELEEEILDGELNGEINKRTYRENLNERLRRVTPYIDVLEMVRCGDGHLIKKFKVEHGQICDIEFYDRLAAMTLVGRHLKMFTDKTEVTVNPDTPIGKDDLDSLDGLSRDEINRRIAAKLKPKSK